MEKNESGSPALNYLLQKEWSTGNGQCPECLGVHEGWHGHPIYLTADKIGHKKGCPLATAIASLGGDALVEGAYKDERVYEIYWTEAGFLSTRVKSGGLKQ